MKSALIWVVVALIIGGGIFWLVVNGDSDSEVTNDVTVADELQVDETRPADGVEPTVMQYTIAEVAERNTEDNCWTYIGTDVYDLTDYAPSHPGGADQVYRACGTDGTELFETKGGQGQHSASAEAQRDQLKVGELLTL